MRAAALLQTALSEAGRVDAASCSSNVALGRPITNPRTGLAGRLKAAAQKGPNPDSLLSDQRAVVRKYQRSQGANSRYHPKGALRKRMGNSALRKAHRSGPSPFSHGNTSGCRDRQHGPARARLWQG